MTMKNRYKKFGVGVAIAALTATTLTPSAQALDMAVAAADTNIAPVVANFDEGELSGILISPKHVLTTAHADMTGKPVSFDGGQSSVVKKMKRNGTHIAIAELETPIKDLTPAKLSPQRGLSHADVGSITHGYGHGDNHNRSVGTKFFEQLPIIGGNGVDHSNGRILDEPHGGIFTNQFTTRAELLEGDKGGPLIDEKGQIIGVALDRADDRNSTHTKYYDATLDKDWIDKVITGKDVKKPAKPKPHKKKSAVKHVAQPKQKQAKPKPHKKATASKQSQHQTQTQKGGGSGVQKQSQRQG